MSESLEAALGDVMDKTYLDGDLPLSALARKRPIASASQALSNAGSLPAASAKRARRSTASSTAAASTLASFTRLFRCPARNCAGPDVESDDNKPPPRCVICDTKMHRKKMSKAQPPVHTVDALAPHLSATPTTSIAAHRPVVECGDASSEGSADSSSAPTPSIDANDSSPDAKRSRCRGKVTRNNYPAVPLFLKPDDVAQEPVSSPISENDPIATDASETLMPPVDTRTDYALVESLPKPDDVAQEAMSSSIGEDEPIDDVVQEAMSSSIGEDDPIDDVAQEAMPSSIGEDDPTATDASKTLMPPVDEFDFLLYDDLLYDESPNESESQELPGSEHNKGSAACDSDDQTDVDMPALLTDAEAAAIDQLEQQQSEPFLAPQPSLTAQVGWSYANATQQRDIGHYNPDNPGEFSDAMCRRILSYFSEADLQLLRGNMKQSGPVTIGTACSGSDNLVDWIGWAGHLLGCTLGHHLFSCDNDINVRNYVKDRFSHLNICFGDIKGSFYHSDDRMIFSL